VKTIFIRNESTQTQEEGELCCKIFAVFWRTSLTLFANVVPETPRSVNLAKMSKRKNGHGIFTWKYL